MSTFIKRCRENAGLTQQQLAEKMNVSVIAIQNWESGKTGIRQDKYLELAEIFNVPVEELIKEILIESEKVRKDLWPDFLFNDDTNSIIDTLHLNLAQQELFGLMYIYEHDQIMDNMITKEKFNKALKSIPYGFIDKVGSIQFMNQSEGLFRVIKYVDADFLLKVLKQNPETEFNVRRLSKEKICEFIDIGHKAKAEEFEYFEGGIDFSINMYKAKILLPVLNKVGAVHITDGHWANHIRKDIPTEILSCILEMCDFNRWGWEHGDYKNEYNISYIRNGLETLTEYKNTASEGETERWMLSINQIGGELLKWLEE